MDQKYSRNAKNFGKKYFFILLKPFEVLLHNTSKWNSAIKKIQLISVFFIKTRLERPVSKGCADKKNWKKRRLDRKKEKKPELKKKWKN